MITGILTLLVIVAVVFLLYVLALLSSFLLLTSSPFFPTPLVARDSTIDQ